jgi:hypothetical protein
MIAPMNDRGSPARFMRLARPDALARAVVWFALIAAFAIGGCDSDETQPVSDAGLTRSDGSAPDADSDGGAQDAMTSDAATATKCEAPRVQTFGACVASSDGGAGWSLSGLSVSGRVDGMARGSWGCQGLGRSFGPELGDQSWRFHVVDGANEIWVGILLPWRAPFVKVGDTVSVDYQYGTDNEDGSTPGFLMVRDGDGSALFWAQLAYQTDALTPPKDLDVRDATDACEYDDGCGLVRVAGFRVQSGDDEVVLGYGERGEVGDYVAFHAGNAHGGEMTGDCSDWSVNASQLVVVRGSIASLDARDAKPCGGASCKNAQFCDVPAASTCDSWDPGAICEDAPSDCASDCPGVCGCDHRFYCNACAANAAGTGVAEGNECRKMDCGAAFLDVGSHENDCMISWTCFGQTTEIDCAVEGTKWHCECKVGPVVIQEFDRDDMVDCQSDEIITACGIIPAGS